MRNTTKKTSFTLSTERASCSWLPYVGVHSVFRVDVVLCVFCKETSTCVFRMNILHSVERCHLNIQLQPMVVKYNTVKSKLQKDLNKYINVYLEVLYKCTCYTSADYIGLANVIYFKFCVFDGS